MKHIILFLFRKPFLFLVFVGFIHAQPHFTAYSSNPMLDKGQQGEWDSYMVILPSVFKTDSMTYIFYTGYNQFPAPSKVGYAYSRDSYNFTKYESNPVLIGDGSGFDSESVLPGDILMMGDSLIMFYTGSDAGGNYGVGRATALTPSGPWTRADNAVLVTGSSGEWDESYIHIQNVFKNDDGYVMFYSGGDTPPPGIHKYRVGMATSPDGIVWTKYDDPSTTLVPYAESDPVFMPGAMGTWDDYAVWMPSLLKNSNGYEMFYLGLSTNTGSIGYATSVDGINWVRSAINPIFRDSDDLYAISEGGIVESPAVTFDGEMYNMYYDYGVYVGQIGMATAPRTSILIEIPADYPTIQAGIDAAIDGDTVLVAEGTYYENVRIISKAVTLASYFLMDGDTSHISKTIINGSQPINTDLASVITVQFSVGTSIICGLTITGGYGEKIPATATEWGRVAAGVNGTASNLIVCDNRIMDNVIDENIVPGAIIAAVGGGIGINPLEVENLTVKIRNNLISGNRLKSKMSGGAGIVIMNHLQSKQFNYIVEENIVNNNEVINTDFWKSMGGGLSIEFFLPTSGTQIIRNNTISDNQAICDEAASSKHSFGGGMYIIIRESSPNGSIDDDPGPYIYNNIISGNYSDHLGGGVAVWRAYFPIEEPRAWPLGSQGHYTPKPSFINNTLVNNSAGLDGAGFYIMNHVPFLMNNILWDDLAGDEEWGEIFLGDEDIWARDVEGNTYGSAVLYNNIIKGSVIDTSGNVNAEPLFADAENGDFSLVEGSPGIGWGLDSSIVPKTDYYGNVRPYPEFDEFVDMGAIESPYERTITAIEVDSDQIPNNFVLFQNYPNPFNPKTIINYKIPINKFVDLSIYNLLGQKVATLVSAKQPAGTYKVEWDATGFASGIYLYKLETSQGLNQIKKLVLLK